MDSSKQATPEELRDLVMKQQAEIEELRATVHRRARWFRPSWVVAALVIASLALGVAGRAFASVPDPAGVIHGCPLSSGLLKVIDTSTTPACSGNETALNWNQTGPQGPQGVPGPAGPTGPQGPAGPAAPASTVLCPACALNGAELSAANLPGAYLRAASMSRADLSMAILHSATLDNADLSAANLTAADLRMASLVNAGLTSADLHSADLSKANLRFVNFNSADLTGANLTGASMTDDLSFANLSGANLTGANLTGATGGTTARIGGVIWSSTICPDGTNSDNDGNTCMGHGF